MTIHNNRCTAILFAAAIFAGGAAMMQTSDATASTAASHTEREARLALDAPRHEMELVAFEPVTPDRIPNYLRAFAMFDGGPDAMANMARSVLYDGRVEPDLKMAMGLATASIDRSPYTAAHMSRLLAATERGRALMQAVESALSDLKAADRLAIEYARALTKDVKGFDDETFSELRRHYNEPQIIELTLVVCFFSYFNRIVEPLNLPVETWALEPASERFSGGAFASPEARVGLLTDDEVRIIAARLDADDRPTSSLGVKVPNSVRAMARVSDIREAWSRLGSVTREDSTIGETMQHFVSNEVSYRNDCYYCITHQVQKLHNVGIPIELIARAADSPDSLPKRERQAVLFARKVTDAPASITDRDFTELVDSFTERGAMEILLVAARFNFMNRFTSGLDLPSEPDPIATYTRVETQRGK